MIKKHISITYEDTETGFVYHFDPIQDTLSVKETESGFEARYLIQDDDPVSPDEDGDDNLFLVHYHRDFDVRRDKITENDARYWYQKGSIEQAERYHIFPVAAYIHSGIRLSLGSGRHFPDYQWDVSHVGLVLASKEEWPEEEEARKAAESLIQAWNEYLSGEVYFIVKEAFDRDRTPTDYDIVGGYSGMKYALEALKTDI